MERRQFIAIVGACAAGTPLTVWAANRRKGKNNNKRRGAKNPGPGAGAAEYIGNVTVAEGARRILTVQGKVHNTTDKEPSGSRTFIVPSSCWIEDPGREKSRIRLSDLSAGTQVRVGFMKSAGDKWTAKSITVGGARKSSSKKK
jgi:hypothetical protein